jgi:hypothetical protein
MQDEVGGQGSCCWAAACLRLLRVFMHRLNTRSLCVMLEELANVAWGTKVTSRGAEPVANGLRQPHALGSFSLTAVSWLSSRPSVVG